MKHFFTACIILCALIFTSCSTILGTKNQRLYVFSNAESAQVTVNDSVYNLPANIYVKRSKNPLKMSYQSNTKQVDTLLKARHGALFVLGNVLNAPAFGAGYIVDLTNHKRFRYKKNIFFNDKDSLQTYELNAERYLAKRNIVDEAQKDSVHQKFKTSFFAADAKRKISEAKEFKKFNPTEGTLRFNLQPPTLFLIGLSKENQKINRFTNTVGGVGLGLGFDYYYKNDRFFSFETSVKGNVFDIMWWTSNDRESYKYDVSLRNGHRWKRFEVSYGASFTYSEYNYKVFRQPNYGNVVPMFSDDDDYSTKFYTNYQTFGFSTLFHYQLTSVMFVGIRYNPSIYSTRQTGSGFNYEHVLGFDYRIKF
ncbi:hypothetical protein H1R17_09645 [Flavobacterium sp. xlx-214]|uniref:hypothetical protein n=1 Tax=unclassified Flavobacterium TaxID=196869 RepID=UPI0013D61501|nr:MULTISPECIES: hypothetical protein [unclassified Flavobacterium]MBA5793499.1 hypothetical protein [Flavobacterium sp. xlx-221]QMI82731.1 hypothetical protein H1R17_09645 [Flavobacterium sp. xlx-214]